MTDAEVAGLLQRVAASRQEVATALRDCNGEAGLQHRMGGLYLEVEDARQALEAARRKADSSGSAWEAMTSWLFGKPDAPRTSTGTAPAVQAAAAAYAKAEQDLEEVNAAFRRLRALREDLKARQEGVAQAVAVWPGWDGAALRVRMMGLSDAQGLTEFRSALPGALYLELLAQAPANIDALKQTCLQADALTRLVEGHAADSGAASVSSAGGGLLGGRKAAEARDSLQNSTRDSLRRVAERQLPDLKATVTRVESELALIGIRPAVPAPGAAAGPAVPGVGLTADAHQLRYDLQAFERSVRALRTAAEAELNTLLARVSALGGAPVLASDAVGTTDAGAKPAPAPGIASASGAPGSSPAPEPFVPRDPPPATPDDTLTPPDGDHWPAI